MKRKLDRQAHLKKQLDNPSVAEARAKVEASPYDAAPYYDYGMSLFREDGNYVEAEDAFSHGLALEPFDGWLRYARGRSRIKQDKYWEGISDLELACRLAPDIRIFRYYMATAENLAGHYEESANDFLICAELAAAEECCPTVTWLYLTYLLELGDKESAKKSLSLVPDDVVPRQMDYGYHRCVQLFKGIIASENFINIADMEQKCQKKPGRIELELNMMYYGLYAYGVMIGDEKLSREAISKLIALPPSEAFGYKKGIEIAKRMGLAV